MITLTVSSSNTEELISYLEHQVLPQLNEGYISGLVDCDVNWSKEGDEEYPNDEQIKDALAELDCIPCDESCNEDHKCRACSASDILEKAIEKK